MTVKIERLEKDNETLGYSGQIKYGLLKNTKVSSDTLTGLLEKVVKVVSGAYEEVIFVEFDRG